MEYAHHTYVRVDVYNCGSYTSTGPCCVSRSTNVWMGCAERGMRRNGACERAMGGVCVGGGCGGVGGGGGGGVAWRVVCDVVVV